LERLTNQFNRTYSIENKSLREADVYKLIFSTAHRLKIERLYKALMNSMRTVAYENCEDTIKALSFIQEMAATAIWKYDCRIGKLLERFITEFDRLDLGSEQLRLYRDAQST
jgi:hypothetical protein